MGKWKIANILEKTDRRVKWSESWDSGALLIENNLIFCHMVKAIGFLQLNLNLICRYEVKLSQAFSLANAAFNVVYVILAYV